MANNGPITNYKPDPIKCICNKCGVNFNTTDSLEVHVKYHHDNLMKKWAIEAAQNQSNRQRDEANNNNNSSHNNNAGGNKDLVGGSGGGCGVPPNGGGVGMKREYVSSTQQQPSSTNTIAAADSTEQTMKTSSKSPDSYNSGTPEMGPSGVGGGTGHPPTPQSYHSAPSPYQNPEPANFSPGFHNYHPKPEPVSPGGAHYTTNASAYPSNAAYAPSTTTPVTDAQYFNMEPPHGQMSYAQDYHPNKVHNAPNFRYHPYANHSGPFDRSGGGGQQQVTSSAGGHHSPQYGAVVAQNPQPTPSPSPKQCDKCGFVCETAGQLLDHLQMAHPATPFAQQPPQFQFPGDNGESNKLKQEGEEPQAEILDLDSQKVHVYQTPEEQEDAMKRQQELAAMNGGHLPHSVSAMISWPTQQKMFSSNQDARMFTNGEQKLFDEKLFQNAHHDQKLFQPHQMHSGDFLSADGGGMGVPPNMGGQPPQVPHPYRPYDHHIAAQPPPPVITSSQVPSATHPPPSTTIQPPVAKGANWKSNEARRPKTYNCSACNKWFTSSGHLKRHYNTTLHKNAVKSSGQPDPATLPISVHHHPSRDPNHQTNRQQQHQDTNTQSPMQLPQPADESNSDDNGLVPAYERAQHPGLLQQPPSGPYDRHPPNIGGGGPQSMHPATSLTNLSSGSPPNGEAGPSAIITTNTPTTTTSNSLEHSRGLQSISTSNIPPHLLTTHHTSPPPPHLLPSSMPAGSNPLPPFNLLNQQPHMMGMQSHHQHSPTPPPPISPALVAVTAASSTNHHIFHPMAPPPQVISANYPNGLSPHVTQTIMAISNQPLVSISHTTGEFLQDMQFTNATDVIIPDQQVMQTSFGPLPSFAQFTHLLNGMPASVVTTTTGNVGGPGPATDPNLAYQQRFYQPQPETEPQPEYILPDHMDTTSSSSGEQLDGVTTATTQTYSPDAHIIYRPIPNDYQITVLQPVDPNVVKVEHYSPTNQNNNHYMAISATAPQEPAPLDLPPPSPRMFAKHAVHPGKVQNENDVTSSSGSSPTITSSTTTGGDSANSKHKCVDCDKTFNKACYLTQHNKTTHSGEKPFKCNRCGKRFAEDESYQCHLKKHAGDKPHKCEQCPKQFNHKTDLRRHMCLHSGHKPYVCEKCGKGFIRKDHMIKHCETHLRKARASNAAASRAADTNAFP